MLTARPNLPVLTLLCSLMVFCHCTSSSIGDDSQISSGRRQVTGHIELEEEQNAGGAFIWIEGFDVGTFADERGDFALQIPSAVNAEVSGSFQVYFYVANYELSSTEVAVRDGEFVYGTEKISEGGTFREAIQLRQFLAIRGSVTPNVITRSSNANTTVTFAIGLIAPADTATVVLPKTMPGFLSAVFFRNLETGEISAFQGFATETQEEIIVDKTEIVRELDISFIRLNFLSAGRYEFFPYLLVKHESVPPELLQAIGLNVQEFGLSYTLLPFSRDDGSFVIRD